MCMRFYCENFIPLIAQQLFTFVIIFKRQNYVGINKIAIAMVCREFINVICLLKDDAITRNTAIVIVVLCALIAIFLRLSLKIPLR